MAGKCKDCSTCRYKLEHIRKMAAKRDAKRRRIQPERKSARSHAQYYARRWPDIVPDRCACCGKESTRLDKHHPDWETPLKVVFLCPSCHRLVHQKGLYVDDLVVDLRKLRDEIYGTDGN